MQGGARTVLGLPGRAVCSGLPRQLPAGLGSGTVEGSMSLRGVYGGNCPAESERGRAPTSCLVGMMAWASVEALVGEEADLRLSFFFPNHIPCTY